MAGDTVGELELDRHPLCSRGYHPDVPLELEEGEEVSEGIRGGVQEEEICHVARADIIRLIMNVLRKNEMLPYIHKN